MHLEEKHRIIFQQNHFIQSLNVLENVLIAQSMIGTTPDVQQAKSLLDSLNLSGKYKSKMHELSQGERQSCNSKGCHQ